MVTTAVHWANTSGRSLMQSRVHGADGAKPAAPENPILAGQYPDYIVKALSDYQSGKRKNPVMKTFADQLKRQDMQDVAAWFSSQPSVLHFQR